MAEGLDLHRLGRVSAPEGLFARIEAGIHARRRKARTVRAMALALVAACLLFGLTAALRRQPPVDPQVGEFLAEHAVFEPLELETVSAMYDPLMSGELSAISDEPSRLGGEP